MLTTLSGILTMWIASDHRLIHTVHTDLSPTMQGSEIQHHTLNKLTAVASNDEGTVSLALVATSLDAQALPHNKQDRAAFPNAMALKATFWSDALAQRQSILRALGVGEGSDCGDARVRPSPVPIGHGCPNDLRSLYDLIHSLAEIVQENALSFPRGVHQPERPSFQMPLVILRCRLG